jgi:Fe-S oxidoreductase
MAVIQLLENAGVSFGSLGANEMCCGDPAHQVGAIEIASRLKAENTKQFIATGVQKVLAVSPHCMNAFQNDYSGLPESVEIEHYSELFSRLIDEGRLHPVQAINRIVTYHDPCYLGRHNQVYTAPRYILQNIPGLTLIEMASNKENSLCCGGGGGSAFNAGSPGQNLGRLRVEEAIHIGAETIATACPYCLRMLNRAVRELGVQNQIEVKDLAELLMQAVVLKDVTAITEQAYSGFDQEVLHV